MSRQPSQNGLAGLTPRQVLGSVFGYPSFRPGQLELISAVLAGQDALGILPTGAGKSLVYQIAARLLGGTTLVVSPLIALMKDQVDGLLKLGFKATFVDSTLSKEQRRALGTAMRAGNLELIYAAPEALPGWLGRALGRMQLAKGSRPCGRPSCAWQRRAQATVASSTAGHGAARTARPSSCGRTDALPGPTTPDSSLQSATRCRTRSATITSTW